MLATPSAPPIITTATASAVCAVTPDEMIGGVLRQRRRYVLDHRPIPFGRTGGHQREHIAVGDVVAGERDIRRQRSHPGGAGELISRGRHFGGPATAQHLVDRDDRRIQQRRKGGSRWQHEIDLVRVARKDRHPARRRHLDRGRATGGLRGGRFADRRHRRSRGPSVVAAKCSASAAAISMKRRLVNGDISEVTSITPPGRRCESNGTSTTT